MKKSFRSSIAAVAALSAAVVCAFASSPDKSLKPVDAIVASTDTINISKAAVSPSVNLFLPQTPDSLDVALNTFDKSKFLDSFNPLTGFQSAEKIKEYEIIDLTNPKTSDSNKKSISIRRFITSIRPDAFFKGDIIVKEKGMVKGYLNGKEILSKNSFDTVPSPVKGSLTIEPNHDALLEIQVLSETGSSLPQIEIIPNKESASATLLQDPTMNPVYNIYTIVAGERIANINISPDGNYLLMKETFCEDGVNTDSKYYVSDRRTNRKVIELTQNDAQWLSSEGATLWFTESDNKSGISIITMDIPTMHRKVMGTHLPEDAVGGNLAPDNKYIVYYSKVDGKKDSGIMRRLQSPDDRQPSRRNSYYLSAYCFDEKAVRPLTYGGPSTYLLDISPDSKKILYSSTRETPEKFPFYESILVELDVNTLKTDTIRGIDSSLTEAIYSPDGKQLLIAAGPNAFNGIGLNAGNFKWGNDYDIQLYLATLSSGELSNVRPLTRDLNPSVMTGLIWNHKDKNIYFRAQKGYDASLYSLNPASGKIKELPTDVDFVTSWSVSRNHPESIAYTGMSYDYMGRAYLLNSKTGKNELIADPNKEYISRVNSGMSAMWSFECPAEAYSKPDSIAIVPTKVECTFTLPPNFDSSKKYPLIVYYYGGTTPTTHTNHSPYTPNLMASRGYVVLTLNPSGTIGYGQEFSARHVNAWGDRTADEIIYGVKRFCEEHPYVDTSKIGCIGASYGGFITQLLQTKTELFAAAVSHAGISNITSYWGEGWWGYSYNSVAAARSYPWNNPDLFTKNSPLFAADKIHTPLLLLHGNRDTNVPIGESIQLYNALKMLGREVEFVTIDGSDHIVIDFQQRKEWHSTIMAWFERWLKGDDRWWNEIYK